MMARVLSAALFAATVPARPLPPDDGPLEPSYQNEVDHAVALGERWLAARQADGARGAADAPRGDVFGTNGLSRAAIALKLVSAQRGGGWWVTETNAAPTRLALDILRSL